MTKPQRKYPFKMEDLIHIVANNPLYTPHSIVIKAANAGWRLNDGVWTLTVRKGRKTRELLGMLVEYNIIKTNCE
jgi:hypothetical protein